jgi:hypothetical protein
MIHDTNDTNIDWYSFWQKWKGSLSAPDKKHLFTHTGSNCIRTDESSSLRATVRIQWLKDQQLQAFEVIIFPRGHHSTRDHRKLH